MKDPNWVETKKEYDIADNGELLPRKVTLEPSKKKYAGFEKKEAIDVAIRILSLMAIFIPLWLFFQQQKAEVNKQRVLFRLDLYSKITTEIHSILDRPFSNTAEFEISRTKLFYELDPKLKLLGDTEVIYKFKEIKHNIPLYLLSSKISMNLDSFRHYSENMMYFLKGSYTYGANDWPEEDKELYYSLYNKIDSIHAGMLSYQEVLREDYIRKEPNDTAGRTTIKRFASPIFKNINQLEESERLVVSNYSAFRNAYAGITEDSAPHLENMEREMARHLSQLKVAGSAHKLLTRNYNAELTRETEKLDSLMILSNRQYYGG